MENVGKWRIKEGIHFLVLKARSFICKLHGQVTMLSLTLLRNQPHPLYYNMIKVPSKFITLQLSLTLKCTWTC